LDEETKEKLSIDRYLTLLEKPDVSLAVQQRRPEMLKDAVSAILKIEAFYVVFKVLPTSSVQKLCTHEYVHN